MHIPKHHHEREPAMTEVTTDTSTTDPAAPVAADTIDYAGSVAAQIDASTVDTTIPAADPSDPVTPATVMPQGPTMDQDAARQFQLFQAWKAQQDAAATQAAQSGAVTAGPSHHVFHSSVDIPEGVDQAYQTARGISLYVAEDADGNTRTYAVQANGSTESVEGDVYDSVVAFATLLGL